MAERFVDCPYLTINGSSNLADRLNSVPMLDDAIRSQPLTPLSGYSRTGGVLHDAVFSCELIGEDGAGNVTEVLLGTRTASDDAGYSAGIRGTSVAVEAQRKLGSSDTAGTASATAPILTLNGIAFSIPEYEGGPWGDKVVFVVQFAVQGPYSWKTS